MKFAWTPSWVATAMLLVVIVAAVFTIPFIQPTRNSVAFVAGEHRVEGGVVDISRGESTVQITLDDIVVDGMPKEDRVLVTAPRDLLPNVGDWVVVSCALQPPEPFDGFAYDKYLAIRGVYATCRVSDPPLLLTPGVSNSVSTALTRTRMVFIRAIERVLPQPQATLLAGLLVGDAQFSDAWRDRFLASGTSHIVAASGFNVSIVVLVCFGLLTFIGMRRQHAFWVLAVAIVLYVVLAGAEPAVVRAGVMGGLVLLARKLGRKTTMRNVVLLAVATMLTIEPRLLLYDVGFQLSVVSTVALIWVGPRFAEKMRWVPTAFDLREVLSSTLAATLCTLPIVVLSFGSVSFIGPLVNLLVLPFVPFAMGFGAMGMLVAPLSDGVARIAMLPAWGILSAMLGIIRVTASIPFLVTVPFAVRGVVAAVLAGIIPVFLWQKGLFVTSSLRSSSRQSSSQ